MNRRSTFDLRALQRPLADECRGLIIKRGVSCSDLAVWIGRSSHHSLSREYQALLAGDLDAVTLPLLIRIGHALGIRTQLSVERLAA